LFLVNEIPGGKGDRFAVQVQGLQTKHVKNLLGKSMLHTLSL